MGRVVVINVVGLTPRCLGEHTPHLSQLASRGFAAPMSAVVPAVTCTAQATMLTGLPPALHGIVANGWFNRELGEVMFWKQSNALVQGEKVYEAARRRSGSFTCAKLFWWFNQGAPVDWSVTPKPHYGADGSKVFAITGTPPSLPAELEARLGPFPFHTFWGPMAGLPCSDWIARAAAEVLRRFRPTLTLVYLPHLDYDLQRFGTRALPRLLREVDALVGLIVQAAEDASIVVVSEYGLRDVNRPVHINRALRQAGLLQVRDGPFGEMLETFTSDAFAVADHQIAHIYTKKPARTLDVLRNVEGIAALVKPEEVGLNHPRSGDLIALSRPDAWFTYYYWLDDRRAPDFARTVDIHRKPGYDPCELFLAPSKFSVALTLMKRKLGFRTLLRVVPLNATLVKGSHGLPPADPQDGPVFICTDRRIQSGSVAMESVKDRLLALL